MDFEKLSSALAASQVLHTAAELHGILCGQLCAGARPDARLALELLEAEQTPLQGAELPDLTVELAGQVSLQMQKNDYSFQPLLPDDDEELPHRLLALSEWCEGFNIGFGAGFTKSDSAILQETREVLVDFAAIAQLDEQPEGNAEENEEHYMQLLEYVRMAAISVYMQNNDGQHASDAGNEYLIDEEGKGNLH